MGVVVRRYIDILTIIINFLTPLVLAGIFGSSIPTSLFIFKCFFGLLLYTLLKIGLGLIMLNINLF